MAASSTDTQAFSSACPTTGAGSQSAAPQSSATERAGINSALGSETNLLASIPNQINNIESCTSLHHNHNAAAKSYYHTNRTSCKKPPIAVCTLDSKHQNQLLRQ